MDSTVYYQEQLHAHYPELQIDSIVCNDEGQYNDVLIVNNRLVFRFATVPDAADTLRQEIAILHAVQPHLTLSVPAPVYNYVESDILGEVFMGYRLIPGQPLWREAFAQITDPVTLDRMAYQLARFLYDLHHLPAQEIIPIDLPLDDTVDGWRAMYEGFRDKLFPSMRSDACDAVTKTFNDYLRDPVMHHFEPCLRHGDFGTGNILFDSERQAISGILDFGATCLGDPAVDFAGLFVSFGREFYERCYPAYPAMKQALPRVQFALSTFSLQEALFGVENNDREAFESGIADYR